MTPLNSEAALLSLIAELYATSQAQQDRIKELETQLAAVQPPAS